MLTGRLFEIKIDSTQHEDDSVKYTEPLRRREAPKSRRPWKGLIVLFALVFLGYLVWALSKRQDKSEKPAVDNHLPLVFDSPYRNVRPDVRYVGDETCARCHAALTAAYRKHPMSRSLAPVSLAKPLESYDSASHNPFEAQRFHYQVERRGQQVFHSETLLNAPNKVLIETKAEVQFALGSGARGRSYLPRCPEGGAEMAAEFG
jgi:hypothetical protein